MDSTSHKKTNKQTNPKSMESGDLTVRASKSAKNTDILCVVGSFFQLLRTASWWSSATFFYEQFAQ